MLRSSPGASSEPGSGGAAVPAMLDWHYRLLCRVARLLTRLNGLDEVSQTLVEEVGPALEVSRCLVGYYPITVNAYVFHYKWVAPWVIDPSKIWLMKYSRNAVTQALVTDKIWRCDDIETDERVVGMRDYYRQFGVRANMFVGVWVEGRWWGSFGVHQHDRPRVWTSEEADLLKTISGLLALAISIITKREAIADLEERLRDAILRPGATARAPVDGARAVRITRAEAHILELITKGMTNTEIAAALNRSRRTVETHITHMLARLGLRNRVDLVRYNLGR